MENNIIIYKLKCDKGFHNSYFNEFFEDVEKGTMYFSKIDVEDAKQIFEDALNIKFKIIETNL